MMIATERQKREKQKQKLGLIAKKRNENKMFVVLASRRFESHFRSTLIFNSKEKRTTFFTITLFAAERPSGSR